MKLGSYTLNAYVLFFAKQKSRVYFAGLLIQMDGASVHPDRLASLGGFYPYGEARNPATNPLARGFMETRSTSQRSLLGWQQSYSEAQALQSRHQLSAGPLRVEAVEIAAALLSIHGPVPQDVKSDHQNLVR